MNPLETLGLKHGATDDEIKKAYKKMAFKHHPDKGGDIEKFKEINEAYTTLTNSDPIDTFPDLAEIFQMFGMMASADGFLNMLSMPKGPTIQTSLTLTLLQLERGGEFKVKYTRKSPTGKMLSSYTDTPIGRVNMVMPEEIEKTYETYIIIPPCCDNKKTLMFPGLAIGDNVPPGTLSVSVILEPHKSLNRVSDTLDLKLTLNITLKEALIGFEKDIELLDKQWKLKCESIVNPYESKRIEGLGLHKSQNEIGDLIISFRIDFPVLLDQQVKSALSDLL